MLSQAVAARRFIATLFPAKGRPEQLLDIRVEDYDDEVLRLMRLHKAGTLRGFYVADAPGRATR